MSDQAVAIPSSYGAMTMLASTAFSRNAAIMAPQVITGAQNEIKEILPDRSNGVIRSIQNVGTNALLFTVGGSDPDTEHMHGILAGGTADNDGLGSVLDLSKIRGVVKVTSTESGTWRVCLFDAYVPNAV